MSGYLCFLLKTECDPHAYPPQATGAEAGSVTLGNKVGSLSLQMSCEFHSLSEGGPHGKKIQICHKRLAPCQDQANSRFKAGKVSV